MSETKASVLQGQMLLFSNMGIALVQIQKTEQVLKFFTSHALQGKDVSWNQILVQAEKDRRKTLGELMIRLRKMVDIAPEFDDQLAAFLRNRNIFVHDIFRVPGFGIGTDQELSAGIEFTQNLARQAEHVRDVVMGLARVIANALRPSGTNVVDKLKAEEIGSLTADDINQLTALAMFRIKS